MDKEKLNYCPDCDVYVDDCLQRCPLCGKKLTDHPEPNAMYPDVHPKEYIDQHSFNSDLLVFFTFLFIGGSIVINMLTWNGIPWFISVATPIIYTWILVRTTILSDMSTGKKVLLQLVGIMGMMLAFDFTAGWTGWSYEYILPLLIVAAITYMDIYSYIHKSYWRDNLLYAIILVLISLIPIVFYFTGITHTLVPMILSSIAGILTVLGILRFAVRRIGGEMKKRFHI